MDLARHCAAALRLRNNPPMKPLARWALRTVALWALAKGLEIANARLKQFAQERKMREQASRATALPRTNGQQALQHQDLSAH